MLASLTANQAAFLNMTAVSEGTASALGDLPYRTVYGKQHIIVSFDDHPYITGEWPGVSLANLGPSYEGLISTAAGKYQINKRTWLDCKMGLGLRIPPMFSPDNQDAAALWLIKEHGALAAVNYGQVDQAVALLSNCWASFTSSSAPNQPHHAIGMLLAAFNQAGGRVLA
jgi:muramidase (phage lysozyme)